jgi:hypothetical protein
MRSLRAGLLRLPQVTQTTWGWRSTALQDLNEVVVFGDDHGLHLTSLLENLGVLGSEKAKVLNVHRSALTKVT